MSPNTFLDKAPNKMGFHLNVSRYQIFGDLSAKIKDLHWLFEFKGFLLPKPSIVSHLYSLQFQVPDPLFYPRLVEISPAGSKNRVLIFCWYRRWRVITQESISSINKVHGVRRYIQMDFYLLNGENVTFREFFILWKKVIKEISPNMKVFKDL